MKLAQDGGTKALTPRLEKTVPMWPPVIPATARHLADMYKTREWSFNGPNEKAFSKAFADYTGASHCVPMVNGTVTLECALAALGVGRGDEVIVPGLTWLATAMAASYLGATPVFVDVEADTLCLDPIKVREAITPKTKAIIPVHLYGSMADMDELMKISKQTGIPVIEDCAHAHGGVWNGKAVGTIGSIGSFSFQQSKTLSSGEGGACVTMDPELNSKLFQLKHIGYDLNPIQGRAWQQPQAGLICHNYRITEFESVVLLDSLRLLKNQTKRREKNAKYLANKLKGVPGVRIQSRGRRADVQGFYCMVFLVDAVEKDPVRNLDAWIKAINAEGIGVGKTYGPVYTHSLFNLPKKAYRMGPGGCPVSEKVGNVTGITLYHKWLLGDTKLMDAIALAFKKVAYAMTAQ